LFLLIIVFNKTTLGIILSLNSPVSELELMQKIFESDSNAVENLYDKYASLLYTFIKKIIKDKKATEEVLEDVFLTICKKINYFDFETKNIYPWLITLAKNKAVYNLRKEKNQVSNGKSGNEIENNLVIPRLSHLSEPLDMDKAIEYKDKIEKALNSLTDAQQYVIYLAFYEGLPQDEIADRLKIPLQTVESKIKISLVKLNENFTGTSYSFSVKNQIVDMIYPYVLGCLKDDEMISVYNTFKSSEIFPWKLLGKYQNLVSLLPVILDLEEPPVKLRDRIVELLNKSKDETDKSSFQISSPDIKELKPEESETRYETGGPGNYERVESFDEMIVSRNPEGENVKRAFEPVIPFKTTEETIEEKKYLYPKDISFDGKRSYSGIITFIFVLILIVATVIAYLFYKDRSDYYENRIETLNKRLQTLVNENLNRPEIPGIGELKDPQTVNLKTTGLTVAGSGKIVFSFADKRGYLHILNLPLLTSEKAYQLWGNFDGDFVSLGLFKVSSRPDYYPFTIPAAVTRGPVEFYVVESTAAGSKKPGSKVYLRGSLD